MKKFIVFTLFGLLIMAFSGMAYAQKLEFKASGAIDADFVWETNVPFYFGSVATAHARHDGLFQTWITPAFYGPTTATPGLRTGGLDRPAMYLYSRGLLKFDAVMSKELSGTIYFEIDGFRWGAGPGSAGAPGGMLTQAGERNTLGVWSADRAAVEVKNVYIDFGLPYFGIPVPMTVRVGVQPFGVRPNIFLYTDGAGFTAGIKVDPVMIIPMWAKIHAGTDFASDDATLYGLHTNAKIGTFTVGGYALNYNMNTYPLTYATGVIWASNLVGSSTSAFSTSSSYGVYIAGTQRADFWWFGVYADGKAGPVNLNLDFVYDQGKVERRDKQISAAAPRISEEEVKYSGWAGRIKVDYPWEKFNFGGTFMYASGSDANKTSTRGLPGDGVAQPNLNATVRSTKVKGYVIPPGSESSPGSQESIVMYSCFNASADGGTGIANTGNYSQVSRGAFGGTWFAKAYGSAKLTPWYKVTLQGLYIGDTTKHGNTFGTARKNPLAAGASQILRDDNDIGWEFDIINEIDIYKNLKLFAGAGILFAGDGLDVYNGATGTAFAKNFSPKNPWNVTWRLLYSF